MTERPLLFSSPMVRAILEGRKTQTRRVLKVPWAGRSRVLPYEPYWVESDGRLLFCDEYGKYHDVAEKKLSPYGQPGDRLWVREAWAPVDFLAGGVTREEPVNIGYRADLAARCFETPGGHKLDTYAWNWDMVKWRPSIHMPKWASRITLEVTEVRVQCLQDISEEDARAECIRHVPAVPIGPLVDGRGRWSWKEAIPDTDHGLETARHAFGNLWDSINGERPGCSWRDNPWVWAISFKVL